MGGADDSRRAQQLVGLGEDAEGPILAAGVGMVLLGLLAVGIADLLQGRVGRDAQHLERIDLEAEQGHLVASPRPGPGLGSGPAQWRGACRPLDNRLRRYDARATFRSSTPSSEPRSFWRKAGWVWMNSSLTVAIERSSIRPRLIPIRTLDRSSIVSSLEMVWAVLSTP